MGVLKFIYPLVTFLVISFLSIIILIWGIFILVVDLAEEEVTLVDKRQATTVVLVIGTVFTILGFIIIYFFCTLDSDVIPMIIALFFPILTFLTVGLITGFYLNVGFIFPVGVPARTITVINTTR